MKELAWAARKEFYSWCTGTSRSAPSFRAGVDFRHTLARASRLSCKHGDEGRLRHLGPATGRRRSAILKLRPNSACPSAVMGYNRRHDEISGDFAPEVNIAPYQNPREGAHGVRWRSDPQASPRMGQLIPPIHCFRNSIPCPPVPLSTLRAHLTMGLRKTRGQDGLLLLSCKTLSFSTSCRFIPALWVSRFFCNVLHEEGGHPPRRRKTGACPQVAKSQGAFCASSS